MVVKSPIAGLFGKSPFKPLQAHMRVVVECTHHIPGLFAALCEEDRSTIASIKDEIFTKEQVADALKMELRAHLPKSLLMPVARGDLIELLTQQDSIAGTCQDIAGLLVQRKMEVPDPMKEPLMVLTRRCVEACDKGMEIVSLMDELVETGFRGRKSVQIEELVDELNVIESDTDVLAMELVKILFDHEDEMKPVTVMFWYHLIQWISLIADNAEKVGNRLRLMTAR